MNKHTKMSLNKYYVEAESWNHDRLQALRSSKRVAWWIAAVAAAVAFLEATALALLMPLKTVEPYALLVDRTTGFVEALKPVEQAHITPDASLTRSFLYQYVIGREGFDRTTLKNDYRKIALLSADSARSSYLQTMQLSNPGSPLRQYPQSTIVDVRVKSVSPIGAHSVLVRFDTIRRDAAAQPQRPQSWVAAITYRYSDDPMSVEDRFINPLGFQVISYRKDPEAPPPPDVSIGVGPMHAPAISAHSPLPAVVGESGAKE